MKKALPGHKLLLFAMVAVLVVGVLALAGCSCSSEQKPAPADTSSSVATAPMYTVPNVVSLKQSDAKKAINAAGFQVGEVKKEASDTIPLGQVISQDPKAHTSAPANSKVNLVISSGKEGAGEVVVPDLKGMTHDQAEKALADVKLVGVASNPEETDQVEPGLVFKQSVDPGAKVKEGTKVAFTIALSPAQATVPGVIGMTHDQARKAITDAKLSFDSTTAYDDNVAKDTVISQSIVAGTQVKQGTIVTVTLSLGPKPQENVQVPDVSTYSWPDAEATLHSAGLAARYTGDPSGVVVAQDIAPGTEVAPDTLVTVTLEAPTPQAQVPYVVGMTVSDAQRAVEAAGLVLDAGGKDGTVTSQWPAAGETVDQGTTVSVTVEGHDEEVAKKFMGEWNAGRASMTIDEIGSGFTVTINWSSSATESTSWQYVNCYIEGEELVSTGTGTKTEIDTDEGEQKEEVVYNNGSARFSIDKNGKLKWKDLQDDAGKGLKFEKVS